MYKLVIGMIQIGLHHGIRKKIYERCKIAIQYIESGNEKYYLITELLTFIEECTENNIAILSIEFFTIISGKIIPFESLSGLGGSSLYEVKKSHIDNVHICNDFIKESYIKCSISLEGLYFNLNLKE